MYRPACFAVIYNNTGTDHLGDQQRRDTKMKLTKGSNNGLNIEQFQL